MKRRAYLISGGCGFLGQYIAKALHDHDPGAELCVLDLYPRPTLLGIELLDQVRVVRGDLRQPETFVAHLAHVETVIHCAGVISFKRSSDDPSCQANIAGMRNLLQAAVEHKCDDFIFISSISSVDCRPGRISDETMVPDLEEKRLTDPYGYSKLVGERALLAEKDQIRGIVLNPSVILGPGSPLIEKILRGLRWIPFCPMIQNTNSFVDVRDVARAVILALSKGMSGERYIVTTENMDNLTFMSMVLAQMGKKAPVFPAPQVVFSAYDSLLWLLKTMGSKNCLKNSSAIIVDKAYSNAKIQQEMGWRPIYSLEETIRYMITVSQKNDESERQDHLAYGGL
jgi:dihydroflavonol-4-reductase